MMKRTLRYYRIMWLRHDFAAGLSVFLVALPLCLGIALASGAPVYAGVLSGVIGGIIVAIISGSDLSVSGPAAGLTPLVAAAIISLGNFRIFLLAVMIAGLFQLLLGLLKLGIIANYFPSAVIKGMLAAIGIILISKQIPLVLGYDQPDFWTSGFIELFSSKNFLGNLQEFSHHITYGSILIGLTGLLLVLLKEQGQFKIFQKIPMPLLIVLTGIGMNQLYVYISPEWVLKSTQLVKIPANFFSEIQFPEIDLLFENTMVWKYGIMMGLLATLETLLCVEAIDKLDRHNRITPVNRELVAQGIGNMCCGALGGLPVTAVVVRGAANVDAGGRTKLASITHGVLLFLAVLFVPFLLNRIPLASLAVILIWTGFNLTKPKLYISVWKLKWKQFLPFFITILLILLTDLLIGVFIGLMISIYFIIQNNFKAEYKTQHSHEGGLQHVRIKLNSNVTFLNKVNLKRVLDEVPEYSVLTIDGTESHFIDYDILEIISAFDAKAHDRHIEVHLLGVERVNVRSIH